MAMKPIWSFSRLPWSLVALVLASKTALAAFPDCVNGPMNTTSVCDFSLDPVSRARSLVSLMNITEKINNTGTTAPGVPRLGLPAYQWWSEALHGVASSPGVAFAPAGQNFSYATSFPEPILMGAAFDNNLISQVAAVVSTEARAFNNFNWSGIDFFTPNINPVRDPRWGRSLETPGEDPYHLSSYVSSLIPALQFGDDTKYQKLGATCKHYAAYDVETNRTSFNAVVTTQDLVEYFLPPFRTCARDVNVSSIMCSYNAVNGIPSCANDFLLQTVLRDHWGWGETEPNTTIAHYIASDCDAVFDVFVNHKYTSTGEQAAADALLAGTDLDCGEFYSDYLPSAYDQNLFNESILDRALVRSYAALFKLGYFDPPDDQPYRQLDWSAVDTPQAQQLAYTAAWEGITLLKNVDQTLPIDQFGIKNVALVGPLGSETAQMQGNYQATPYLYGPIFALQQRSLDVTFVQGTNITSNSTDGFADAVAAAASADLTIYVGGIDTSIESEGMDRLNVSWPGNQLDLIAELSQSAKTLIVFQMGGGQIDDTELVSNPNVKGLLWAGYPGQDGGTAMMDIVFGTRAPAGRLPVTQYPADFTDQVAMTDMSLRPSATNPGRTYKWYTGTPVFPFGYGLHYTNFSKTAVNVSSNRVYQTSALVFPATGSGTYPDQAPFDSFAVQVTNVGTLFSDYVALGFLSGEFGPTPYPNKALVSYARLSYLGPGSSQTVTFNLTLGSLARADEDGNLFVYPGNYTLIIDVVEPVTVATFQMTGDARLLQAWPGSNITLPSNTTTPNPTTPSATSSSRKTNQDMRWAVYITMAWLAVVVLA